MVTVNSLPLSLLAKPQSRALRRGAVGDAIDGRSADGRFLRRLEMELVAQIGGSPSFAHLVLIRQAARATLQLESLNKTAGASWTEADARTFSALNQTLARSLETLGLSGGRPMA